MRAIPEISDAELAFGSIRALPAWTDIPDEFKRRGSVEVELFNTLFFGSDKPFQIAPREGVDQDKAVRAVRACMASWEPKHEHKEAGVAYLLNQWFEVKKGEGES